jgi:hypothetical protein
MDMETIRVDVRLAMLEVAGRVTREQAERRANLFYVKSPTGPAWPPRVELPPLECPL